MVPETHYVRTDGISVAYQLVGEGPADLLFVPGWVSNVEVFWEEPRVARFLQKLAAFSRLILFDKRGTGLSDRVTESATLEERMDDVRSVMDAVGSSRAALFGYSEGGAMCALFAATYPERTSALITMGSYARRTQADDYPFGPTQDDFLKSLEAIAANWGGPVGIETRMPSVAQDPSSRQWWSRFLRMSAGASEAVAVFKANAEIDIRHLLPSIRVPALILHAVQDRAIPVSMGRYMAQHLPNARLVELNSVDHLPFFDKPDDVVGHIRGVLTGASTAVDVDTSISTLMFTDIVGSTEMAVKKGDQRYADLLEAHHKMVRRELSLYRGQEIETTGDGFVLAFDGPTRAIKCGVAITKSLREIGVSTRVGLHTGECEIRDGRLRGVALNVAARVMALAPSGGVLVSETVRDLVAGSGLKFIDAGQHKLKGLPNRWRLFEVDPAA